MTTVKVHYAKTQLSALLARVEAGEKIVIARGDREVAKLVPVRHDARELGFGTANRKATWRRGMVAPL
ncbi:MAG: type II toxin-antitoxin system Phd/YefM family antitoxin [Micrococcus sp.]|nr:type II toxin-antitoxin system Phd/YefM family antitoxin [Micrococcus sp.]